MSTKKSDQSINEIRYQRAKDAISALHCDTSVSMEKCIENLESLRGEIGMMIDACKTDIENRDA